MRVPLISKTYFDVGFNVVNEFVLNTRLYLDSVVSVHTNNSVFYCLVKSSPVKLKISCTVILPPTVSVL